MENAKTTLSHAASYEGLGDWNAHGLDEVWNQTHEVTASVEILAEDTLTLSPPLRHRLHLVAARRGVTAQELLESWLQERLERESTL